MDTVTYVTIVKVKEPLSPAAIRDGATLVRTMDRLNLCPRAAFWSFDPDEEKWSLHVGSEELQSTGPLKAYDKIQHAIDVCREEDAEYALKLPDTSIIALDDPLVRALGTAFRTGMEIRNTRYAGGVIDRVYVNDVLIYRMAV